MLVFHISNRKITQRLASQKIINNHVLHVASCISSNRGYRRTISVIEGLDCFPCPTLHACCIHHSKQFIFVCDIRTLFSHQTFGLLCTVIWLFRMSKSHEDPLSLVQGMV